MRTNWLYHWMLTLTLCLFATGCVTKPETGEIIVFGENDNWNMDLTYTVSEKTMLHKGNLNYLGHTPYEDVRYEFRYPGKLEEYRPGEQLFGESYSRLIPVMSPSYQRAGISMEELKESIDAAQVQVSWKQGGKEYQEIIELSTGLQEKAVGK
ncbi:hypothetical protein [Brevibacillus dissolubilis]|uniref:hypothetical protein n=1 Tax=Brevibacillus dissolubilis TaxID=1844116 RepID=UPI001115DE52|nr:hypothetical protein [Brevibacillus dissolubilis]